MASLIKKAMHIKLYLEGTVNGHPFKCEGKGEGNPYDGTQIERVNVIEGGPLPFAYDILTPCCMYGSKTFVKHLSEIPDYFKQSFPQGFTWERTVTFEDGGYLTALQHTSLEGDCLIYKVNVIGVNFPADGPVMQKRSDGWEPCTEMLYPRNGVLCGQSTMGLKCTDGNYLTCHLRSTYRSKKPAGSLKMPGFHFTDHRIEVLKKGDNGKYFEQYESAVARYCDSTTSQLKHH